MIAIRRAGSTAGLTAAGAAAMNLALGKAHAADIPPTYSSVSTPKLKIMDYSKIPQRTHVYAASDRAKKIVQKSMTMDTLFSGVWPSQWSCAEAPEFQDEIDRCKEAGFKVLAACPSADSSEPLGSYGSYRPTEGRVLPNCQWTNNVVQRLATRPNQ